jgi:hypothetical protein
MGSAKQLVNLLLLAFYCFGIFCLPMGDFSVIKDLPGMYRHCKTNEEADLTISEFLFEHVSGVGQLWEGFEHEFIEPEEKGNNEHTPLPYNFEQQQIVCIYYSAKVPSLRHFKAADLAPIAYQRSYASRYVCYIFRPPMAV